MENKMNKYIKTMTIAMCLGFGFSSASHAASPADGILKAIGGDLKKIVTAEPKKKGDHFNMLKNKVYIAACTAVPSAECRKKKGLAATLKIICREDTVEKCVAEGKNQSAEVIKITEDIQNALAGNNNDVNKAKDLLIKLAAK